MYKIRFEDMYRHDYPDLEGDSIVLTPKEYKKLPSFNFYKKEGNFKLQKGTFYEPVRNPVAHFPAVFITDPDWNGELDSEFSARFYYSGIKWILACLDVKKDYWIAFNLYDVAPLEESYGSTVRVCFPRHSQVFRVEEKYKEEIIRKFYP